jgi:ATP sulfurylase
VAEAVAVFGTTDESHPGVDYLMNKAGAVYIGGTIEGVRLPQHFDFNELRLTPAQLREKMEALGWSQFVAFQTRNPMHRAHIELTRLAATKVCSSSTHLCSSLLCSILAFLCSAVLLSTLVVLCSALHSSCALSIAATLPCTPVC